MTEEKRIKYSGKDTVFRDMFSNSKYLLQLYRVLHPEDESITEADLEIVTLQSILLNGIYNDLGFLVRKDRLMVLVEAQSTWTMINPCNPLLCKDFKGIYRRKEH